MASRSIAIAQAVTDELNDQDWPVAEFIARRVNLDYAYQESLVNPICMVYPNTITYSIETRTSYRYTHEIGLMIAKAMVTEEIEEQDTVVELVELVPQALLDKRMSGALLLSISDESSQTLFDQVQLETGNLMIATTSVFYYDIVEIERA